MSAVPDDWSVGQLDLDAYLSGSATPGPPAPSEATLAGLYRAHLAAIRFENLDVFLRGAVDVSTRGDPGQDRLPRPRRLLLRAGAAVRRGARAPRLRRRAAARPGRPGRRPGPPAHPPDAPGARRRRGLARRPRLRLVPARARCSLRRYRSGGPQEVDGWIYEMVPDSEHGEEVWKLREYQAGEWVTLHRWDDAVVQPGRRGAVQPLHVHAPGLVVHLAAGHRQARPGRDPLDPRPHLHGHPRRPREDPRAS